MPNVQLAPKSSVRADHLCDERQVAEILERLQLRYPGAPVDRAVLEGVVREGYREFETARIQTFVAVFVERRARMFLERRASVHIGQGSSGSDREARGTGRGKGVLSAEQAITAASDLEASSGRRIGVRWRRPPRCDG
jgi:hypothetical protein